MQAEGGYDARSANHDRRMLESQGIDTSEMTDAQRAAMDPVARRRSVSTSATWRRGRRMPARCWSRRV